MAHIYINIIILQIINLFIMKIKLLLITIVFGFLIISCNNTDSNKAIMLNNKGSKYLSDWNYDSALFYFNKALEIDSTYFLPRINIVNVCYQKDDYKKAIDECLKISNNNPEITWIWFLKGLYQDKIFQSLKAKESYAKAVSSMGSQLSEISDKKVNQIYRLIIDYSIMLETDSLFTPKVTYTESEIPFVDSFNSESREAFVDELLSFIEIAKLDLILYYTHNKKYINKP